MNTQTVNIEELKKLAAKSAIKYVEEYLAKKGKDSIIGVGTGSTIKYFIEELALIRHKIDGAVASSLATETLLKEHGIPLCDLNSVTSLPLYVDGADEINMHLQMIKGGGGALTREKIITAVADHIVCIADASKYVEVLGKFPLPIEVIPMARSYVARELVKLGGDPVYRQGFVTDNGNVILDVWNLNIEQPISFEQTLNNIVGVVTNGLFAQKSADLLVLATEDENICYYQRDVI